MITSHQKSTLITLLIYFSALLLSCEKSGPQLQSVPLANLSVDIAKGRFGNVITISGVGFSADKNKNQVKFNGKLAEIVSATTSSLGAKVPLGAGSGNITVTVNGTTVTGPAFTYELTPIVSTYAGDGLKGYADGHDIKASFTFPYAIAMDATGNLYVSDVGDAISRIRKISTDSLVTTLATLKDAKGDTPPFQYITAMTIGADGNIYAVENGGVVRKVTMAGTVTTYYDGRFTPGYNFAYATGIAFDKNENMYISVSRSNQVQVVTSAGVASNFVGTGEYGGTDGFPGSFYNNTGIEFDATGLLYIADYNNNKIRTADASRQVKTIAGFSKPGTINGNSLVDGPISYATFGNPNDIAFDAQRNLYITESGNNVIRLIDAAQTKVSTLAGSQAPGYKDGVGISARFNIPTALVVDNAGTIYITDQGNHVIRKIRML